ncbi:hypothetical protein ACF0H5_003784 [Mactra antiquata]
MILDYDDDDNDGDVDNDNDNVDYDDDYDGDVDNDDDNVDYDDDSDGEVDNDDDNLDHDDDNDGDVDNDDDNLDYDDDYDGDVDNDDDNVDYGNGDDVDYDDDNVDYNDDYDGDVDNDDDNVDYGNGGDVDYDDDNVDYNDDYDGDVDNDDDNVDYGIGGDVDYDDDDNDGDVDDDDNADYDGNIDYSCPANGECEITKRRRKACQACRFQKCLFVGMLREGVRLDRVRGGRQKYKRSPDSYPYVQQIFPIVKKQCLDNSTYSTKGYVSVADNKTLQQLIRIESQLEKLYARPDSSMKDDEHKFLTILSDLADRELVITISWAKQVPGFSNLSLSDQMNLLQHSWLEINLLNLVHRSSPYQGVLRIAEDFSLTVEQAEKYGCSKELDTLTRKMCKKFTSMNITRDEYLLLKSIILFNIDVVTERSDAGKALQEKLHEALTDYVKSRSNGGLKRVGQLYLLLPAMTHLKLLAKQYWFDVKKSGKIMMHKLFLEMLEADS